MTAPETLLPSPAPGQPRCLPLAVAGAALGGMIAAPLAAQPVVYARSMANDLGQCAPDKGPAVRVVVSGLDRRTATCSCAPIPRGAATGSRASAT